jgi:hypothetical protein
MSEDLIELERSGWSALSSDGDAAARFYEEVLAPDVLFLFPGGMVIDSRAAAIDSMRGVAWDRFELVDERVIRLSDDCAAVAYRAKAARGGVDYHALCTSTYTRVSGRWLLAVHQHTPV